MVTNSDEYDTGHISVIVSSGRLCSQFRCSIVALISWLSVVWNQFRRNKEPDLLEGITGRAICVHREPPKRMGDGALSTN
jgi:hypothetical protein